MLTVLMATYNGAGTLPDVLSSYCKLDSPSGGYRLVIVDNGSTDNSKEIIASFESRLPLTYLFEPTLGKSAALNTGLSCVSGDLVVMTADDALPKPDWLVQMRVAADSHPSFAIFGGAVVPHWEIEPESWILPFRWVADDYRSRVGQPCCWGAPIHSMGNPRADHSVYPGETKPESRF